MSTLEGITLVEASVPETASFREAATVLRDSGVPAIAVLDARGKVTGLFTSVEMLDGLFPQYLRELRHTAFAKDDPQLLADRAAAADTEPVTQHMRKPVVLDLDTSSLHAAERFMHTDVPAVAVVSGERFVGMLARAEFALAMLRRLTGT